MYGSAYSTVDAIAIALHDESEAMVDRYNNKGYGRRAQGHAGSLVRMNAPPFKPLACLLSIMS